jgi:hypothetical protein
MTKPSREKRIADLNDKFRKSLVSAGRTYMTAGVNAKGPEFVAKALIMSNGSQCGPPVLPHGGMLPEPSFRVR